MDLETEAVVHKALTQLFASKMAIIIAHRLSTIKNANMIYYMENGHFAEIGSHLELLDLKGKYYQLFDSASL
jgi:ATP-binding cassette subfamily B protein